MTTAKTARAAVQYQMVATSDDARGFRHGSHEGSYVFDFRKEDGQWRFSRQLIVSNNAHNPMFQPANSDDTEEPTRPSGRVRDGSWQWDRSSDGAAARGGR